MDRRGLLSRVLLLFLGCLVIRSVYAGQDSYLATPSVAAWDFIQSVGGIRVETPQKKGNGQWVLPVICDVSGTTTVTRKPTAMNSGLVVTRMLHRVTGNEIHISVVLNSPLSTSRTSRCTEIVVGGVNVGEYRVLYEAPNEAAHALGFVTFK